MKFDINLVNTVETPFYLYDALLLNETLDRINKCIKGYPVKVHYAVKANGNPGLLEIISGKGLGADCVSGGEISAALQAGFNADSICYACVGKTDAEIKKGIELGIGCFNVESIEELRIIESIGRETGRIANVALRVNPNIDAHTHHYITTGLEENKFGIDLSLLDKAVDFATGSEWLNLKGLHFHIGSQITIMEPFRILCDRINSLVEKYREKGITFKTINVGGGLGIDYDNPDRNPIPPFEDYFKTLLDNLHLTEGQELHCELGRAVVAQCGSLISRVILVKEGINRKFIILDAGMNDLIRPALYQAHHKIENLSASADAGMEKYDVVGPVCESSDTFGVDELLPHTKRGDIMAIRSAGAYGESMASTYNMRQLVRSVISE